MILTGPYYPIRKKTGKARTTSSVLDWTSLSTDSTDMSTDYADMLQHLRSSVFPSAFIRGLLFVARHHATVDSLSRAGDRLEVHLIIHNFKQHEVQILIVGLVR